VYQGSFDDPNRVRVFATDIDFITGIGAGSVNYDARYGFVYSAPISSGVGLTTPGEYSIQFEYMGIWAGTAGVRFSQSTYSGGDAYVPVSNQQIGSPPMAIYSIDAAGNAAFINGGGADLLLTVNYIDPTDSGATISGLVTPADTPICFLRGSMIETVSSSIPVELIATHESLISFTESAIEVAWIGYQRRTPEFAAFQDYLPVKISAGAVDDNVPIRDLYLSPDHAVLIDGYLIHAKALVNGKTIVQMTEWEGDIEYYHIETEKHEIIFAEGLPCETFIDNVSRAQFDNYAEYLELYPYTRAMRELPLPRVRHRRQVPCAIWNRLIKRADKRLKKQKR